MLLLTEVLLASSIDEFSSDSLEESDDEMNTSLKSLLAILVLSLTPSVNVLSSSFDEVLFNFWLPEGKYTTTALVIDYCLIADHHNKALNLDRKNHTENWGSFKKHHTTQKSPHTAAAIISDVHIFSKSSRAKILPTTVWQRCDQVALDTIQTSP